MHLKALCNSFPISRKDISKTVLLMKLTAILIIAVLQVNAKGFGQNLTLIVKDAPLEKVFDLIKKQSGLSFIWDEKTLARTHPVTLKLKNVSLQTALEASFKDQPLTYSIIDNLVVVKQKEPIVTNNNVFFPKTVKKPVPIKGKVVDSKGNPIIGASIIEKGFKNGTSTDQNGEFSINVSSSNAVLIFSSINFMTEEFKVGDNLVLNISLKENISNLTDIVVVGYGTQRKKDVTGSVVSIKTEDIIGATVPSLQQVLQGRASGVQVSQTSGALDGRFSVTIRGVGSINSNTEPLYVVDGVPLFSAALSTINPDDIETFDILKDASASAIYGARAANGVVIITTKIGKANAYRTVINSENGVEQVSKLMKMLSSEEQRQLTFDAFKNSGLPVAGYDNPNDPLWKPNNNWQKLMTQTAQRQKYSLGIYGGTEKTQFGISGEYLNREGIIRNTELKSYGLRFNVDHKLTEKLKIYSRLAGNYQSQKVANDEGFLGSSISVALNTHSHIPLYDSSGNFTAASTGGAPYWGGNDNPLASLLENERTIKNARLLANIKLEYAIINGLTLSSSVGGDLLFENGRNYFPVFKRGVTQRIQGSLTEFNSSQINWLSDITLRYQKTLALRHSIDAIIGGSLQKFIFTRSSTNGTGTTNNFLNQLSNQTTFSAIGSDVTSGLASGFFRVNYGFDNRYLLTGTVRRDGSSKFSISNRYGTFPSASFGWRISNEKFYHSKTINELKLRTSYGLTGNQNISDFAYITKAGQANYVLGNSVVLGNAAVNQGTPDLKWESSKQFDAGLDIGMVGGRIYLTVDYYNKTSKDLLIDIPLPATAGVNQAATVNLGSVGNKGWEFAVNSKNTVGKLKWNTNFNITFNKNKVIDIGKNGVGAPFQIPGTLDNFFTGITNLTEAGRPIGAFYMYVWDGIWQLNEKDQAVAFGGAKPGDMKYKDINGDGKFTTADKTFVNGSPHPKFYGGLTNNFEYKNFLLSLFINGASGNKKINTIKITHGVGWPFFQNLATSKNRWTPTNPSNTIPAANQLGYSTFLATQTSTYFLEDASFIRLKNISLIYSMGRPFLQRTKLQDLKFIVSATNVLTITEYNGYDPEAASVGNQLSAGIDYAPYPLSKIYTLAVQLTF